MKRKRESMLRSLLFVLTFASFAGVVSGEQAQPAADAGPSDALRKVMEANCQANEKEKIEDALATIHPESPTYATTRDLTEKLFQAVDLKHELKSFRYIGSDETYAVGRAKIRSSSTDPQKFRNNESDLMLVFRKDKDSWKIWSQSILEIKFD